ncbi:MAG: tetratricopeptide repeat protein [Eubacteriales bacterium]|nr:tetratricopeptide repeat protein [Eubacteriales bacterium]
MKKTIIALVVMFVCYLVNLWLGLAVTLAAIIYLVIKNLPSIYALLGTRAYASNNIHTALNWYRKALATHRAGNQIKINYAMTLLRTGDPEKAEEEFDSIINSSTASDADKRSARQYRCMAYIKQGLADKAMSEAKELFAEAKTTITYGIMGYFMQLVDTPDDELLALCEEAYDYNSNDRDIIDNLIVALIRNNQLTRAAELAEELRENHPSFVEAFYHSAMIELKLGNKEEARKHLAHTPECRRSYLTTVSEEEIALLAKEAE